MDNEKLNDIIEKISNNTATKEEELLFLKSLNNSAEKLESFINNIKKLDVENSGDITK